MNESRHLETESVEIVVISLTTGKVCELTMREGDTFTEDDDWYTVTLANGYTKVRKGLVASIEHRTIQVAKPDRLRILRGEQ